MRYRHQFIINGRDIKHYSLEHILRHDQSKAAHEIGALIIENVGLKRTDKGRPTNFGFDIDEILPNDQHYDIEIDAFPHEYWDSFCHKILNIAGEKAKHDIIKCIRELESRTIKKPVNDTETA